MSQFELASSPILRSQTRAKMPTSFNLKKLFGYGANSDAADL